MVILSIGILARIHFSQFLDPFEDPYQNWWISANLVSTGQYADRFSKMTQGNWLPLYHFFGAGILSVAGLREFEALKAANIGLSAATAILVFLVGRRRGVIIGFAAMAFFSFNFIDMIVSGWATAEALATFLVFLGWAALFHWPGNPRRGGAVAASALALATMTRYETWFVVGLLATFSITCQRAWPARRAIMVPLIPAATFMLGYFLYAFQWGFLPELVIIQTSTDVRYQVAAGTQLPALQILSKWYIQYFEFFPVLAILSVSYALWNIRRDAASWIILSFFVLISVYVILRLGNPSFRYVMVAVPFLSVDAALALDRLVRRIMNGRLIRASVGRHAIPAVMGAAMILFVATMLPSPLTFWDNGFATSRHMEPLVRAGEYLATQPLPDGKILITESPIAAYYSGYPPDRILGSRYLPDDRNSALEFLKENVAFIVYVGVPYYPLRMLFPELQNGASTPDFFLLFDANGPSAGWHNVYVYKVLG